MGRRLASVGLRWRIAGWTVAVILVCLGIAFIAVYRGTGSQLRDQIDSEIRGDATDLTAALTSSEESSPGELAARATAYARSRPFSSSSTLMFVLVPGRATSTNQPELFHADGPDNGESTTQQEQENRLSAALLVAPPGYSTLVVPDVGNLRLLAHTFAVRGPEGSSIMVRTGVGEPLASVGHAQEGVARAFVLGGMLAILGALLGGLVLGSRTSRPLRRMAAVAERVDAGDLQPRIHPASGAAAEVAVLAGAFNHMLDRLTDAFAGQRAFVADASHELRTPLTVIRGQLEVLASQTDPSGAEVRRVEGLVQAEIARISRLVDDLLLLAKTEQIEFLRLQSIDLPVYVGELWDGMSLLASRRFDLGPVPRGTLRADPDRLAQALRNLVGNAIEHTSPEEGLVRMRVQALAGGRIRFLVEDDGPGIPIEQRESVFHRFHRTDAARDRASGGTGLGLAIVRAIADAHGGSVSAGESREGGACFALELPGFTPARERAPDYAGSGMR